MQHTPLYWLKRLLPRSLFGRALLILLLPMLLVQLVAVYVFYERHWASINRHMASALAGEIVMVSHQLQKLAPEARQEYFLQIREWTGINPHFAISEALPGSEDLAVFEGLRERLDAQLGRSFALRRSGDALLVYIHQNGGMLTLEVPRKRLANSTTYIFIMWLVGSAIVLLVVAVLFLRNQIRPITRLAEAAERFGKGQDSPGFRPQGAQEVRLASRAFINMRERITRQIAGRVEMLAGISHDLRTPLTRIKLQLEMLPANDKIEGLKQDVLEMEKMIAEYLDYARGEGGEQTCSVQLSEFLQTIVEKYSEQKKNVSLQMNGDAPIALKPNAMRRCLVNIIENALRFGTCCDITASARGRYVRLTLDDDGTGIPADKREEVFLPFKKLDAARNLKSGGVGLGLSIVRDIIHGHGGEITLEDAPTGGLRVAILLPR